MNWLEQFAITVVLGLLQQVIKNPAHKAELQSILVGLANDIYLAYGMVPPTPVTQAAAASPAAPASA